MYGICIPFTNICTLFPAILTLMCTGRERERDGGREGETAGERERRRERGRPAGERERRRERERDGGRERETTGERERVDGEVSRVSVQYHMTEPEKLTMSEKRELIDNVVELARRIGESLQGIQIVYLTMFPRFVDKCCRTAGHMTKEDISVMSGFRKTVDCDIVEELEELGVEVLHWYSLLGWDGELGPDELAKKDVLCTLSKQWTSFFLV
jgi:hypothetical protein